MMLRAPKMAEVESMKEERKALFALQLEAQDGKVDLAEYNRLATDFNRRWVAAGGDAGSGVALVKCVFKKNF